jgi:hypothetical protein
MVVGGGGWLNDNNDNTKKTSENIETIYIVDSNSKNGIRVSLKINERTLKYFQKRSIETGSSIEDLMSICLAEVSHLENF